MPKVTKKSAKKPAKKKAVKKVYNRMITVKSSNLDMVGYDESDSSLSIRFKNGFCYVFWDVPKSIFNRLLKASSIGKFFNKNIKGKFSNSDRI